MATKQQINKQLKKARTRSYLARDFDSFRVELYDYAKTYFGDRIQDFSEAGLGGLLLDMAAMVGDTMSYYLDHQFNELNWEYAVETENIRRHLRQAGVKQHGASPAVVTVTITLSVPAANFEGEYSPMREVLPVIGEGTAFVGGGATFVSMDDVEFAEEDRLGDLLAKVSIEKVSDAGTPQTFTVSKEITCMSGEIRSEVFGVPDVHVPFRKLQLSKPDITEIIDVYDSDGNEYFEVESLSQDTVFRGVLNAGPDGDLVSHNLEILPAPYRFIKIGNVQSRTTTIQFGAGDATTLDDDIVPDPSDLSLPLYGKKIMPRFSIDPNSMLSTQTLGIAPKATNLTVRYRYGGGLSHNIAAGSISTVKDLYIKFPNIDDGSFEHNDLAKQVKSSIKVTNFFPGAGGAPAPDIENLRAQIPVVRQMQSRIVSKEDLLARVYTLPSSFGRVFRAGLRKNPTNPLAATLYVVCQDRSKNLIIAPDALKNNLRAYLNEFRLISDALDILDAIVINVKIDFDIVTTPRSNKNQVVQSVISRITKVMDIKNFQIDQPLILVDVMNTIINTPGVLTLVDMTLSCRRGIIDDRIYSDVSFNVDANSVKGLVLGPPGSIFELKYPKFDIVGHVS